MLFKAGGEIKAVGKTTAMCYRFYTEKLIVGKELFCFLKAHSLSLVREIIEKRPFFSPFFGKEPLSLSDISYIPFNKIYV